MKILQFGMILYEPSEYAKGLRELGHSVDHALWGTYGEDWLIHDYDISLGFDKLPKNRPAYSLFKIVSGSAKMALRALSEYDVIHFHSYPSFYRLDWQRWFRPFGYIDLKLMRLLQKKIFISFWGCDARSMLKEQERQWSPCGICNGIDACKIRNLDLIYEMSLKYCNTRFSCGDIILDRDGTTWMDVALDTNYWKPIDYIPERFRINRTAEIMVYHSFGNSSTRFDVKGTGFVKRAVEDLKEEGYDVDLMFFDKVPNSDLMYYQNQADIVVDQLRAGWYGATAAECMSVGKPVISYIRPEIEEVCPHKNIPIVNSDPLNIKDSIRYLIDNPQERKQIGNESRKFAVKVHDRMVVARKLEKYYREV